MTGDEQAARLVLLALPKIGPARASWLLDGNTAVEVLRHLRAGRLPPTKGPRPPGIVDDLVQSWIDRARSLDEAAVLAVCSRLGIRLVGADDRRWPLATDPEPPALLFTQGRLELLGRRPAVAIVGTRRCSAIGRTVARTFGAELVDAGVLVVSGLASGIDGAAHEGALSAGRGGALAVVGSGLDVVYPKVNAALWRRVARDGLLISEAPPGSSPERWRFPARNRLIAALADVVVVVESHSAGGSLLTVGEAAERGVTVMAVPGAITNPAAAGSNQLLVDGVPPACCTQDVLDQLPWSSAPMAEVPASSPGGEAYPDALPPPPAARVSTLAAAILADLVAGDVHIDDLLDAHRVPIPELLSAVDELERHDLARVDGSTLVGRTARTVDVPTGADSSSHKQ